MVYHRIATCANLESKEEIINKNIMEAEKKKKNKIQNTKD